MPVVMVGALELWADSGASIHMREVVDRLSRQSIYPWVVCLRGTANQNRELSIMEFTVSVIQKRFLRQISWNVMATIRAIQAVRKSGSKIIYSRLDPGMFASLIAAVITRTKLVIEMNGLPTVDLSLYRPNNKFLLLVSRFWESAHYRFADAIVGAPGYVSFVKTNFDVPSNKLYIVPLGVNREVFHPMDRNQALNRLGLKDRPTVVWVGTIAGWQGLESLIKASLVVREKVPNCRINIVGDGPNLPKLRNLVVRLQLQETVFFIGKVSYIQVPVHIAAATICVCTFPGNRGNAQTISSLKTLNYLTCGRPVVTTTMDEMSHDIVEMNVGLAVPPDDEGLLGAALAELLLEDGSKWSDRCETAAAMIGQDRTWDGVVKKISHLLRQLA